MHSLFFTLFLKASHHAVDGDWLYSFIAKRINSLFKLCCVCFSSPVIFSSTWVEGSFYDRTLLLGLTKIKNENYYCLTVSMFCLRAESEESYDDCISTLLLPVLLLLPFFFISTRVPLLNEAKAKTPFTIINILNTISRLWKFFFCSTTTRATRSRPKTSSSRLRAELTWKYHKLHIQMLLRAARLAAGYIYLFKVKKENLREARCFQMSSTSRRHPRSTQMTRL